MLPYGPSSSTGNGTLDFSTMSASEAQLFVDFNSSAIRGNERCAAVGMGAMSYPDEILLSKVWSGSYVSELAPTNVIAHETAHVLQNTVKRRAGYEMMVTAGTKDPDGLRLTRRMETLTPAV